MQGRIILLSIAYFHQGHTYIACIRVENSANIADWLNQSLVVETLPIKLQMGPLSNLQLFIFNSPKTVGTFLDKKINQ